MESGEVQRAWPSEGIHVGLEKLVSSDELLQR